MDIKSLLDQPNKLPTIPKVMAQLIKSFSDEDASFTEIANQLSADPVLSAKLLRLANSAYFHLSRTIGTVDDALRMLGFVMVRNLVLGNGVAAAFRNTKGMDLQQFWHYNLYTASASRWLAGKAELNSDLVFTIGLMHGIGQLHLHAAAAEAVAPIDKQVHVLDSERAALEQAAWGFHNGTVAAELAQVWHFPELISQALRWVVEPLAAPEFSAAAACVHLGAWRARSDLRGVPQEALLASFPAPVADRLGLSLEQVLHDMPPRQELTDGLQAMFE
jgi:HD-like signal output (HDOD) protein